MALNSFFKRLSQRRTRRADEAGSMLDCRRARESASDFLDGDIEPTLAEKIKVHLGICRECPGFFNTLRATIEMLNATPRAPAPETVTWPPNDGKG